MKAKDSVFSIKVLPRWFVFLADLTCVFLSLGLSILLRPDASSLAQYPQDLWLLLAGAVAGINAIFFYAFRTYSGLIRYTNIEVIGRFLTVNTIVTVSYLLLNLLWQRMHPGVIFTGFVLGFNFLLANSLLIGYRLLVRRAFQFLCNRQTESTSNRIKAVVYGLSEESLHIERMINGSADSPWEIVAFLDDIVPGRLKVGTAMPVYHADEVNVQKLKAAGVSVILVSDTDAESDRISELINLTLKLNMVVRRIPSVRSWLTISGNYAGDVDAEHLLGRDPVRIQADGGAGGNIAGKVVLVTGAAGSIGSELVRQLAQCKPELIILCDNAETPLHELLLAMNDDFRYAPVKGFLGSVCDEVRMRRLFERYSPDIVFHAGAYKHVPLMEENPSLAVLNNVLGTKVLAELSVEFGVQKFVLISTDKAVNPTNVMGASKRISEIFVQSYFHQLVAEMNAQMGELPVTRFVTTRFGNVLGSNGSVIRRFQQQLRRGGPLTVTHPDVSRYFMTISEACSLVLEACAMGMGGEIFVFDMGRPVRIVDLAKKMIRMSDPGIYGDMPVQISYSGLRPGEKLYEELLNKEEELLPTYHEKIMIARAQTFDFKEVAPRVSRLISVAERHLEEETVLVMKSLVPEYVSREPAQEDMPQFMNAGNPGAN